MEWKSIDLERIHYSVTPTLHHSNDLLFPRRRHPGMARASGEGTTARPLATDFAIVAGANAKTRLERAIARKRSDRRVVLDRRRIHRGPFRTGCFTGRHSLCPRPPAIVALRIRANRQDRNLVETKTTLRRENNSRYPVSPGLRVYLPKERWNLRSARNRLSESVLSALLA
jgi:hypothetical protein